VFQSGRDTWPTSPAIEKALELINSYLDLPVRRAVSTIRAVDEFQLMILSHIAWSFECQGYIQKARDIYSNILPEILSDDRDYDIHVLHTANDMGLNYLSDGNLEQALLWFEMAQNGYYKKFGTLDHPFRFNAWFNSQFASIFTLCETGPKITLSSSDRCGNDTIQSVPVYSSLLLGRNHGLNDNDLKDAYTYCSRLSITSNRSAAMRQDNEDVISNFCLRLRDIRKRGDYDDTTKTEVLKDCVHLYF
jgi:hypothetical protein